MLQKKKSDIRYRIYPSLLDKFQRLVNANDVFESYFNIDENGCYKKSFEEIVSELEQQLLDSINRTPMEPIEAADKGTCFNEIVDCLIERRKSNREDVVIETAFLVPTLQETIGEKEIKHDGVARKTKVIKAQMNGFTFYFDPATCEEAASYFQNCICQHRCESIISTRYGDVELYGYVDEIRKDKVFDIKTTKQYEFGKFEHSWQKDVYPYCLVTSGDLQQVSSFEYTIYVLKGGTSRTPIITAEQYKEEYAYNHKLAENRIANVCERFIEWLELNKASITDKKIFNQLEE